MKKKFLCLFSFASLMLLAACGNDEPKGGYEEPDEPDEPSGPTVVPGSYGAFVVNSGQQASNKPGTLGYLDYETAEMTDDLFYNANKMYVGDTFNDGYIYQDKIYLAVTDSRVFHVIDRETCALITTKQPSAEAGPRYFTSYDGFVYCTLFGSPGYLCKINPETFEYSLLEVGPQPENVVAFNGKLYVAVSDGYSATLENSCIAVVNPSTFTVEKTITGVKNPVQLATNGTQLFVCSWGEYDSNWMPVNYGVQQIVNDTLSGEVYKGNYMALNGEDLYYIDAAFGLPEYTYWHLNTNSMVSNKWIESNQGVYSPTFIGVDPVTNNVFILSNNEGEYGYPSYGTNGYMNMYNSAGSLMKTYETGVGPTSVFFNVYE